MRLLPGTHAADLADVNLHGVDYQMQCAMKRARDRPLALLTPLYEPKLVVVRPVGRPRWG